jgi:hypothetical protein
MEAERRGETARDTVRQGVDLRLGSNGGRLRRGGGPTAARRCRTKAPSVAGLLFGAEKVGRGCGSKVDELAEKEAVADCCLLHDGFQPAPKLGWYVTGAGCNCENTLGVYAASGASRGGESPQDDGASWVVVVCGGPWGWSVTNALKRKSGRVGLSGEVAWRGGSRVGAASQGRSTFMSSAGGYAVSVDSSNSPIPARALSDTPGRSFSMLDDWKGSGG